MSSPLPLSPTQQNALDALLRATGPGRLVTLVGAPGAGKTTILRAAHDRLGGVLIGAEEIQAAISAWKHPMAIDHRSGMIGDTRI